MLLCGPWARGCSAGTRQRCCAPWSASWTPAQAERGSNAAVDTQQHTGGLHSDPCAALNTHLAQSGADRPRSLSHSLPRCQSGGVKIVVLMTLELTDSCLCEECTCEKASHRQGLIGCTRSWGDQVPANVVSSTWLLGATGLPRPG